MSTISSFIQQIDENEKLADANCNTADNVANTKKLLQAGDELIETLLGENPTLKAHFGKESLVPRISGSSYIPETYNGQTYRRPVIDLVQQGGSMLGIALLGYTYTLERAGIRFRSMAGTSAGAINTLLNAALPEKIYQEESPFCQGRQAVKSELLAYVVANKNFASFLDRKGTVGRLQQLLLRHINGINKIMPLFLVALPIILLGLSFGIYSLLNKLVFNRSNGLTEKEISVYDFITGTAGIAAVVLFALLLIFRLFKNYMGINPGEVVYQWLTQILKTPYVNVQTTKDLMDRRKAIKVYSDATGTPQVLPGSDTRLVIISANLTHNRIVKFPENSSDYWKADYTDWVSPAAYVRASMSLPFIFYAFIPMDRHVADNNSTLLLNKESRPPTKVHKLARFVDGGMLSNFPIREFHVPPTARPNYPTFGVLLGSGILEKPVQPGAAADKKFWTESVFKYVLSFISTFRNFYDKDFLFTHPEFSQLVQAVDTKKFNSLDFGMDLPTKTKLFCKGVEAAMRQLDNFDWNQYVKTRV